MSRARMWRFNTVGQGSIRAGAPSGGGDRRSPIPAAVAVKAATAIPIVFYVAGNPVKLGVVAGLARPGGNATGVNNFAAELGAKQLGLLRDNHGRRFRAVGCGGDLDEIRERVMRME